MADNKTKSFDADGIFEKHMSQVEKPGSAVPVEDDPFDKYVRPQIRFQRTLDGDTFEATEGPKKVLRSYRLGGLDAPESAQGDAGRLAHEELDHFIGDGSGIEVRHSSLDGKGRKLGILYKNGKNVNAELLRRGRAKVYMDYLDGLPREVQIELLDAEQEAKDKGLGIWAKGADVMHPQRFREEQERKYGRAASAMGHEKRPRADGDDVFDADKIFYKHFNYGSKGQGQAGEPREREDPGPRIYGHDIYAPESSFLEKGLNALDYPANVSRSFLKGTFEEGGDLKRGAEYAMQALQKKRFVDAANLKDAVLKNFRVLDRRFGKDNDGEVSLGDLADFAVDFGIDTATDPLTYLTLGVNKLAAPLKAASTVSKVAGAANVLENLPEVAKKAAQFEAIKTAGRGVLGGTYALGATDKDASFGEKALLTGAGAAAGVLAPRAFKSVGDLVRTEVFDRGVNWYAKKSRGEKFSRFSDIVNQYPDIEHTLKDTAEWIKQGRFEALDGLTDEEILKVRDRFSKYKSDFVEMRNKAMAKAKIDEAHPSFKAAANHIDYQVTQQLDKHFNEEISDLISVGRKREADAMKKLASHNEGVMERWNEMAFGGQYDTASSGVRITDQLKKGQPTKHSRGILGNKWHVDDVWEKKDFKDAGEALQTFQWKRAESAERSEAGLKVGMENFLEKNPGYRVEELKKFAEDYRAGRFDQLPKDLVSEIKRGHDATYAIYAEDAAKNFLSKKQQEAMQMMVDYHRAEAKPFFQKLEAGLKSYDKYTNWMKANMLFFSLSWMKNNYWDNLGKAFIEGGGKNALEVGAAPFAGHRLFGGLSEDSVMGVLSRVRRDVDDLYSNRLTRKYQANHMQDALKRQVLDNPMFKAMMDDATKKFAFSPQQIRDKSTQKGMVESLADRWLNSTAMKGVARTGSVVEGTARYLTFVNVYEGLKADKNVSKLFKKGADMDSHLKDLAADITRKTFFDYGDVHHFERAVFKRLIPFYAFYAKNMPYWLSGLMDVSKVGRVTALERVRRNIGTTPTANDLAGMSDYVRSAAPRKTASGKDGKEFLTAPSMSMHDAINMVSPSGIGEQFKDKVHPALKAGVELGGSYLRPKDQEDYFTGQPFLPSANKDGRKYLFSRGFKYDYLKRAVKAAGYDWKNMGFEVDHSGNPVTTSDNLVRMDKLMSVMFPMGFVDQVAGMAGKIEHGKETGGEAAFNVVSPLTEVKQSAAMELRNRIENYKKRSKRD